MTTMDSIGYAADEEREVKAILYLDIDGCINPWGRGASDWAWDTVRIVQHPYDLQLSRRLMQRLVGIKGLQVKWLSMWGNQSNLLAPHLGIAPLEVACGPTGCAVGHHMTGRGHDREAWFKAEHVLAVAGHPSHPPFAWIDDELDTQLGQGDYVDRFAETVPRGKSLLICPDTYRGITNHMVEQLEEFVDAIEGKPLGRRKRGRV